MGLTATTEADDAQRALDKLRAREASNAQTQARHPEAMGESTLARGPQTTNGSGKPDAKLAAALLRQHESENAQAKMIDEQELSLAALQRKVAAATAAALEAQRHLEAVEASAAAKKKDCLKDYAKACP